MVQWNIVNKTRKWNSEKVMVEQWHSVSGTVIVVKWKYVGIRVLLEQWNSEVEQCWWKSVVEQRNSVGRTVEQCWRNSVVEQRNSDRRTMWWNSGTVLVEHS